MVMLPSDCQPNVEVIFQNDSLDNDTRNSLPYSYGFHIDGCNDSTSNFTADDSQDIPNDIVFTVLVSLILSAIILSTVIGNVLVIAAVVRERSLRGVGNCLVLSLAVADLLVACLVMPLGAVYTVQQQWTLGSVLCDIWTCCDVLCCTASILHLLAIAVDRYWAVTNIDYIRKRSIRRTSYMISVAWGIACVVSLPPIFGWKDPDFHKRVEEESRCIVSQDVGYQIFAMCSTFYVPLALTLLLYWRIYQVARQRIRNKPGSKMRLGTQKISVQTLAPPTTEMSVVSEISTSLPNSDNSTAANGATYWNNSNTAGNAISLSVSPKKKRRRHKKESLESKRERKAAKTLAIITGVFVVCWLPFFLMVLLMAFCSTCEPSEHLFNFLMWLGYANSTMNPIIYTIFSPDFRSAFKKLLCGNKSQARTLYIR